MLVFNVVGAGPTRRWISDADGKCPMGQNHVATQTPLVDASITIKNPKQRRNESFSTYMHAIMLTVDPVECVKSPAGYKLSCPGLKMELTQRGKKLSAAYSCLFLISILSFFGLAGLVNDCKLIHVLLSNQILMIVSLQAETLP